MSRACPHDIAPGRKPGTERCKKCAWVWPCAGNDCGHSDCISFRSELPKCHFCSKRVSGSPSCSSPDNAVPEMKVGAGEAATWTSWNVRGVTRAVHYSCRDANATPLERGATGALGEANGA